MRLQIYKSFCRQKISDKITKVKSYKFKIRRPAKNIVEKFEQTLELCRELYNAGLQERREAWNFSRISINYFSQANQLS